LTPQFSGFIVTATQTILPSGDASLMILVVGLCNSTDVLASNTFNSSTSYSLFWDGTEQQSQLNADYCITVSAVSMLTIAAPVEIEFDLIDSDVVLKYSSIVVDIALTFETSNLLVLVDLRDQWNYTVTDSSKAVVVYDEDGDNVGSATTELTYDATLKRRQFLSKKTLYLSHVDDTLPHVTFYGNIYSSRLLSKY